MGQVTETPEDRELEEMQLRVGDDNQVHHHYPSQQERGGLGKGAILAAALGAGLLGAAVPTAYFLGQAANQPQMVDTDTDTDTATDLTISKGE